MTTKASPTPASFAVRLGHPVLIVLWSFWMVLLGVVLWVYFHLTRGAAVGLSIACAAMIAIHKLINGFIWCTLTALWLGHCQSQRERSIK